MITYDAAISAGEMGQKSQHALPLFPKRRLRGLLRTVITYDADTSAGEMGQKPQHALPLFLKLQLRGLRLASPVHSLLWLRFWRHGFTRCPTPRCGRQNSGGALRYWVRICDHRSTIWPRASFVETTFSGKPADHSLLWRWFLWKTT